ncbi:MAG: hypothetical protein WBY53_17035 [Acidobacteriaceae bacterium]
MPTLEGIIFIPLALYFFFWRPDFLFPLLIMSTMFQASSVVSTGTVGIQPYYCIVPLYIIRFLPLRLGTKRYLRESDRSTRAWIAFALVSVISAFTLPFFFSGILVFDPRSSIDENFLFPAPLHFQMENVVQSVFLILNVLMVVTSSREVRSTERAQRAFFWSAFFLTAFVIIQALFLWLGLPFPIKLFDNNPGYGVVNMISGSMRPNGTFTEPSMAGAVLAAFTAVFLWRYFARKSNIVRAGITLAACLLVASTSSLVAVLLVFVMLLIANPIFRFPWYIRVVRLKRFAIFFACLALASLSLLIPAVRTLLLSQTLGKEGSHSAIVRLGADAFAFNLFKETYGIGVGLGSNRPSSLAAAILSQVGFLGFVLFVRAAWKTLSPLRKEQRWIGMAAVALLLSMALGVPDLSFPFLWILFSLAAQSRAFHTLSEPSQRLL